MNDMHKQISILHVFAILISCVLVAVIMLDSPKFSLPIFIFDNVSDTASAPNNPSGIIININTATAEELKTLPGIGDVMATKILEHRQKIGKFTSLEQLCDIDRIGESTLDKLRPYLTVG